MLTLSAKSIVTMVEAKWSPGVCEVCSTVWVCILYVWLART